MYSVCYKCVIIKSMHTSIGEHVNCVLLIHVASVVFIDPSMVNVHLYEASDWKKELIS